MFSIPGALVALTVWGVIYPFILPIPSSVVWGGVVASISNDIFYIILIVNLISCVRMSEKKSQWKHFHCSAVWP